MDNYPDPRCICGAQLDDDHATLCRKCTARARWRRRRDGRRGHTNPDARRGGDHG